MKAKLVGVQEYGGAKMNDGTILDGAKVYFNYYSPDVKGHVADGKYLSLAAMSAFGISSVQLSQNIGSEISIDYGPKNKIVGVGLVSVSTFEQGTVKDIDNTENKKDKK